MAQVKTNALLPKGDDNGLQVIAGPLAVETMGMAPSRLRAAIVIFDGKRVNFDKDADEELVTVRVRRIELLLPSDLGGAEKLIRRALEARSDGTVLPLELEDEIREAFDQMRDPGSPQDPDEGKGTKGGNA
jgi:hypothetical protein